MINHIFHRSIIYYIISGTELAERLCVMGIAMNLVTYLVGDMHLSNSQSANIVTNFMGTLYLLALLGGFVADAKFGRYLTVAIFSTIAALVRARKHIHILHARLAIAYVKIDSVQ
jgi:dipeptide/tripeptide permease